MEKKRLINRIHRFRSVCVVVVVIDRQSSSKTFIRSAVQPYVIKWLLFINCASDALFSLQLQHGWGRTQAMYFIFLFIVITCIIDHNYCFFFFFHFFSFFSSLSSQRQHVHIIKHGCLQLLHLQLALNYVDHVHKQAFIEVLCMFLLLNIFRFSVMTALSLCHSIFLFHIFLHQNQTAHILCIQLPAPIDTFNKLTILFHSFRQQPAYLRSMRIIWLVLRLTVFWNWSNICLKHWICNDAYRRHEQHILNGKWHLN